MSRKRDAPRPNGATVVRCAIYMRKSSEAGLEQEFNSLDAQREACEAYIRSQKSTGWFALPEMYDDGGISDGPMDRAALQRLLANIAAGRIDARRLQGRPAYSERVREPLHRSFLSIAVGTASPR